MAKTVTARANRSFGTIREGDVVTIDETDARMQAFLSSGYMTEVEGDDAKGAKKVASLEDEENVIVWDGAPGNRRGATTTGAPAANETGEAEAKADPKSDAKSHKVVKESNGLGDAYLAEELREIFRLVRETHAKVIEIGAQMATAAEQLTTLSGKVDDLVADVRAALEQLEADRENLSPEGQAAMDTLVAKIDAFDAEIGDADGSDPEPEPVP